LMPEAQTPCVADLSAGFGAPSFYGIFSLST